MWSRSVVVRRHRARRLVDSVRSVRPGEEEGRVDCVQVRVCSESITSIDARRAPRSVAAIVAGPGRHRHCPGHQRRQSTRLAPVLRAIRRAAERGAGVRRFAPARSCWRQPASSTASAPRRWLAAADFARRHPSIDLDANVLYVDNGRVLTSAGAAAGFDLCIRHGSSRPRCRSRLGRAACGDAAGAQVERWRNSSNCASVWGGRRHDAIAHWSLSASPCQNRRVPAAVVDLAVAL